MQKEQELNSLKGKFSQNSQQHSFQNLSQSRLGSGGGGDGGNGGGGSGRDMNLSNANLNFQNIPDYKQITQHLKKVNYEQQKANKLGFTTTQLMKDKESLDNLMLQNSEILNQLRLDEQLLYGPQGTTLEISLEEIERGFKFLDEKNGPSKVTITELKKKIPLINPNFTQNDIHVLTNGKGELKSKELHEILKENRLSEMDMFQEAFQLFDPQQTGYIDINRLVQIFSVLGFGNFNKKDKELLVECLDEDKDGKITIEDLEKVFKTEEFNKVQKSLIVQQQVQHQQQQQQQNSHKKTQLNLSKQN